MVFFAWIFLQIPSMRAIFKYSGEYLEFALPVYLLATIIATKIIIDTPTILQNFKASHWSWIFAIIAIILIVFFITKVIV